MSVVSAGCYNHRASVAARRASARDSNAATRRASSAFTTSRGSEIDTASERIASACGRSERLDSKPYFKEGQIRTGTLPIDENAERPFIDPEARRMHAET
jgi:hypothetical protein